ncbi:MAG: hypothetical protein IPM57_10880 [Oligoflexia bacterium]|nr:hypothetical protein [Oligoflexia bacterium]
MLSLFFLTFISSAQSVFYSHPATELFIYEDTDCTFTLNKTNSCEKLIKDKLPKNAVIWDCGKTNKMGECNYQKREQKNPETNLPLSYVEYYYFNAVETDLGDGKVVNVCEEIDPTHGETYNDIVKKILHKGLLQKQTREKIFEQIDRYLNKKTFTQVFDKVAGKKIKKAIFRQDCFLHDRGWALNNFLVPTGSTDLNTLEAAAIDNCTDCKSAAKTAAQALLADMERVTAELEHLEKVDKKQTAKMIDTCNGVFELQNITVKFEKTKSGCKISFPKGCEPHNRLLKMEELSNNILFNANTKAEEKCRDVDASFRDQCGLSPGLKNKENQFERFKDVRKKVNDVLKHQSTKNRISEGIMMCLFNIETTNYDASKVNYTVCDPKYYDVNSNLKKRKKLGVTKPTDYIFKGAQSSAHGLGQVTLEQACFTVRGNPHLYPEIKNADQLDCKSPDGKRGVLDLFFRSGEDESIQIKLSRDTLKDKLIAASGHMPTAIKYYNGDDKNGNFVNFVTSCSYCFNKPPKTKKWDDQDIYSCILRTRHSILSTKKEESD